MPGRVLPVSTSSEADLRDPPPTKPPSLSLANSLWQSCPPDADPSHSFPDTKPSCSSGRGLSGARLAADGSGEPTRPPYPPPNPGPS